MLKKLVLLLVSLSFIVVTPIFSQEDNNDSNRQEILSVLINPILISAEIYDLSANLKIAKSIAISGRFTSYQFLDAGDVNLFGAGIRLYTSGNALNGFYIGPIVGLIQAKSGSDSASVFGTGFELGWMIRAGQFAFDIGLGLINFKVDLGTFSDGTIIVPIANLGFGIVF